jgi:hypothetical protein
MGRTGLLGLVLTHPGCERRGQDGGPARTRKSSRQPARKPALLLLLLLLIGEKVS